MNKNIIWALVLKLPKKIFLKTVEKLWQKKPNKLLHWRLIQDVTKNLNMI